MFQQAPGERLGRVAVFLVQILPVTQGAFFVQAMQAVLKRDPLTGLVPVEQGHGDADELEVQEVKIDESALAETKVNDLEKALEKAIQESIKKSKDTAAAKLSEVTGGMSLPGL